MVDLMADLLKRYFFEKEKIVPKLHLINHNEYYT